MDKEMVERVVLEVANQLQDFPGSRAERLTELAIRFLARIDAERGKEATSMKDHEKRELVNALTEVAVKYATTQQLRQRIAHLILPALAIPNAIPEGMALVPVEPNTEMIVAGQDAGSIENSHRIRRIYTAMLAAAQGEHNAD